MPTAFIALLRGINVGTAKRVAMAELRNLFADLGASDVRTLLNSGNVVFRATRRLQKPATEAAFEDRFGFSSRITILSAAELKEIVAEKPPQPVPDPSRYLVAFPDSPASLDRLRPLAESVWEPESLAVGTRAAYLWCPDGVLKSRAAEAVNKTLKDSVTIRNWSTVLKLLPLLLLGCSASCSRPDVKLQAKNEYVDSQTCAQCHADIARSYSHTGMARSFYAPDAASFPSPKPYFHPASATWYRIAEKKGNGWYQQWWQVGPNGRQESAGESRIDYVLGSGNHVRSYLHRTARGTLIVLPLAWYTEHGGTWALNPGLDVNDPPVGRKVGYDCMFCHNSYPSIPSGHDDAGSEPVFAGTLPQGIDCQRCHGPGGNHILAVRRPGAKISDIRAAILNPGRLKRDGSMEVCMQCHLETTSEPLPAVIRRYDRGPFSYRPGEALSAFQLTFDHAPGTGREAKFEIVNSVYRLRQSKCFLRSDGALGCTTCHNPHSVTHGAEATAAYNKVCLRCHEPAKIAASAHVSTSDCTGCHMPKRRAEDVVHAVITDHLIQRHAPENPLAELAERHGSILDYRGEVKPYGDGDALYTAVAQVTHQSNLAGGIPLLQSEIATRKPERPEFFMELGDALQRAGRAEESASAYRAALEKRPGSALLWARLAQPLRALGKTQEPLDAMLKSVQADPNDAGNWCNLALLQSDLGDKNSAIASFRKSIELDPEFAESRTGLAAALAETGQIPEAEAQLHAALSIRPAMQAAHGYLGYLLANRGELAAAVWHFERAGDSAFYQLSYGITLARMNRRADARMHLEKSLRADPAQPLAHEVLGRLLEADGKVAEATVHYREAEAMKKGQTPKRLP